MGHSKTQYTVYPLFLSHDGSISGGYCRVRSPYGLVLRGFCESKIYG